MPAWKFRIRFRVPSTSGFSITKGSVDLEVEPEVDHVTLEVWPRGDGPIHSAEWLVLSGNASSEHEARDNGTRVLESLQRALARLGVAADFGNRAPKGGLGQDGRRIVKDALGRQVLDDEHGLMVFQAEPRPCLVSVGSITVRRTAQEDRLIRALSAALQLPGGVDEAEQIAYDLYSDSFDLSPDSRLISLVTAIETILVRSARTAAAIQHVDSLIEATNVSNELEPNEKDSLISGLRDLRKQSITSAGVELLEERLKGRKYGGQSAGEFWKTAYRLRSKLVHGSVPRPTRDEVGGIAAQLETMVGNLLAGPLVDLEI